MNIVIIEDEKPAFNRLVKQLEELLPQAVVAAHLDSIEQTKNWFANNVKPDLVFLDVHLADGNAFDLLKIVEIRCPIIFTTAYDEYALDAFQTSSIDYLLKPLKKEALQQALEKLNVFKSIFKSEETNTKSKELADYKKRFMIRFGEYIKTIPAKDIAYFYSENKATFAKTFDGRNFPIDQNLDTLYEVLDPQEYFRINRQYIISLNAIEDMRTYTKARVVVHLNPPVKDAPIVSSERAADFKLWLAGEL